MHSHAYILDTIIFKRFLSLVQLFKETHTVFFMGTVVRRCSVEAAQLERGRQFCFLAKCCQKPDKTAQAGEKLSVNGGWREREREREAEMKIECQREKQRHAKKGFVIRYRAREIDEESEQPETERGRMKLRSIPTCSSVYFRLRTET